MLPFITEESTLVLSFIIHQSAQPEYKYHFSIHKVRVSCVYTVRYSNMYIGYISLRVTTVASKESWMLNHYDYYMYELNSRHSFRSVSFNSITNWNNSWNYTRPDHVISSQYRTTPDSHSSTASRAQGLSGLSAPGLWLSSVDSLAPQSWGHWECRSSLPGCSLLSGWCCTHAFSVMSYPTLEK